MGYALFTARKLSLTTRLNQSNAQLMNNTERTYALTTSIFAKQNAAAMAATTATKAAYEEYEKNVATDKDGADSKLQTKLADIDLQSVQSNADIQKLQMDQTRLDMEKKRLETQLNAYQNELEGVEKAEESAIKKSAPKF